MATCVIGANIDGAACASRFSSPGIERDKIWILNREEVEGFVSTVTGEVSALTITALKTAFKIDVHKNTGMFGEVLVTSDEAAPFYEQDFSAKIIANDTATMTGIEDLVGVDVLLIVKLRSGKYRIVGEDGGVKLVENEYTSGKGAGDAVGDTIVFKGQSNGKARFFFDTDEATSEATLNGYLV